MTRSPAPVPPSPLRLALEIDALRDNWRGLARRIAPASLAAVVKADAYGLGAPGMLAQLYAAGCRDFYVASWAEALALADRPADCGLGVFLGARPADMATALATNARPVLNSAEEVARWRETGRPCEVMVDTGFTRLGLSPREAVSGLLDDLDVRVVHSHLACAEFPGHPQNRAQRDAFAAIAAALPGPRKALAATAGAHLGRDYLYDMVRSGLQMHGGRNHPAAEARPIARFQAEALMVRDVARGEAIGYDATYLAARDMRVAIAHLGYADGYRHGFSGFGRAIVAGERRPLVGRVSMDVCAIDVTGLDVAPGDWIEFPFDPVAAAKAAGLTQYEVLLGLGPRLERVWI